MPNLTQTARDEIISAIKSTMIADRELYSTAKNQIQEATHSDRNGPPGAVAA